MLCNVHDFVYETPAEIKQRKKAMDYYHRCLRIKEAKRKAKLSEGPQTISQPVTLEFAKIENAIIKLQRMFRQSYRSEHSITSAAALQVSYNDERGN